MSGLAGLSVTACDGDRSPKTPAQAGASVDAKIPAEDATSAHAAASPADSLVLRTARGVEIWLTLARDGRDSSGAACVERGLEIRDGTRRTPVPLLYTRDRPRLVNDSTISARLWTHCTAGPEYRVNLRTGQPVRAR